MGAQTTTTTNNIPGASGQEQQIRALLQQLGVGAADQFGNLGGLAQGDLSQLGPTGADRDLVSQSIGASADIARRQLERAGVQGQANLDEVLSSRGIQGSSIESVNRALLQSQLQQQFADTISQEQQQGAQALMNLPFQRANVALNANQALLSRLTGSLDPVLQSRLQERLAQSTSTEKTPFNAAQFALQAGQVAGSFVKPPIPGV